MTHNLSEAILRSAASWSAFKEGSELLARGAVSEAKFTADGWQGTVLAGKRPFRVKVTLRSATDIEARCPCATNRATGAVCAHTVATALACLSAGSQAQDRSSDWAQSRKAAEARPVKTPQLRIAWQAQLPENWREALKRGRLSAKLEIASDETASPADEELSAWLIGAGAHITPPIPLQLSGPTLEGGLMKLLQLPRICIGPSRQRLQTELHVRLALESDSLSSSQTLAFRPDPRAAWLQVAKAWWQLHESSIIRWQGSDAPEALKIHFSQLAKGQVAEIPLDLVLRHLDALQDSLQFSAKSWLARLQFVPQTPRLALDLTGTLKQLRATLRFRYGEASFLPSLDPKSPEPLMTENPDPHHVATRDPASERQFIAQLTSDGWQAHADHLDRFFIGDETQSARAMIAARKRQWIVSAPPALLKEIAQLEEVNPIIQSVGSGRMKLSFETDGGVEVSMAQLRTILTGGGGPESRRRIVPTDVTQVLQPLLAELDVAREDGLIAASPAAIEVLRNFRKNGDNLLAHSDLPFSVTASFRANLRGYQEVGARWLNDRLKRFGGALLADDMGLGKTVQTIAVVERVLEAAEGVVLVLMTTSLLGNWRAEWARFAPGRAVKVMHGAQRDRIRDDLRSGDVLLTTYGTLVRDLAWHLRQDYLVVVADEASLIRNPETDQAKAVGRLRVQHRIALTGTPLENGIRDLWSIFRFVQPGWLGDRESFRERYEQPMAERELQAHLLKRLRLKLSPFVLRRTKQEVAPELPEKLVIDEFCDLSVDQRKVYQALQLQGAKLVEGLELAARKGAARMQILTALLRLRQACCDLALLGDERLASLPTPRRSAKLERLLELLDGAYRGGHKVLIFSQFQKQLLEIEKCILEREWRSVRLDGGTRNRQEVVDQFQSETGPPFFLISLKAGGYGLNLTAADIVVHFDPWWNPAAEAQATDRAHRIGQTRPVTVYRLLTRDTVEEKVVANQAKKRELAEAIDESGGGEARGWDERELLALLAD